jgi:hypothetical protein
MLTDERSSNFTTAMTSSQAYAFAKDIHKKLRHFGKEIKRAFPNEESKERKAFKFFAGAYNMLIGDDELEEENALEVCRNLRDATKKSRSTLDCSIDTLVDALPLDHWTDLSMRLFNIRREITKGLKNFIAPEEKQQWLEKQRSLNSEIVAKLCSLNAYLESLKKQSAENFFSYTLDTLRFAISDLSNLLAEVRQTNESERSFVDAVGKFLGNLVRSISVDIANSPRIAQDANVMQLLTELKDSFCALKGSNSYSYNDLYAECPKKAAAELFQVVDRMDKELLKIETGLLTPRTNRTFDVDDKKDIELVSLTELSPKAVRTLDADDAKALEKVRTMRASLAHTKAAVKLATVMSEVNRSVDSSVDAYKPLQKAVIIERDGLIRSFSQERRSIPQKIADTVRAYSNRFILSLMGIGKFVQEQVVQPIEEKTGVKINAELVSKTAYERQLMIVTEEDEVEKLRDKLEEVSEIATTEFFAKSLAN